MTFNQHATQTKTTKKDDEAVEKQLAAKVLPWTHLDKVHIWSQGWRSRLGNKKVETQMMYPDQVVTPKE